jgi:hypothetical protein
MKLTLSLISLAAILSMLVPAYVYGQSDFRVFVLDDDAIRELDLKATQDKNGQVKKVSGFSTKDESVVQINQGKNLRIFVVVV